MSEMFALLAAALGVWFVFDALRARETAVRIAREACKEYGLQLLDDTVRAARLGIGRAVGLAVAAGLVGAADFAAVARSAHAPCSVRRRHSGVDRRARSALPGWRVADRR